jgi:aspartate kinase
MVTAVTHAYEARVTLLGLHDRPGVAGQVFGALADANVNVDMIIQNEPGQDRRADLSFTVGPDDLTAATDVLEPLGVSEEIQTDPSVGKVSIVGAGMRSHPGVAARVFETLGTHDINIEMISTSPIKISCIIEAERVGDAVQAIHKAFELGAEAVREEDPSGEHRPRVRPEDDEPTAERAA